MQFDWNTAAQAVLIAVSTWYVRRGSKKDSNNASEFSTVVILSRLGSLERDMKEVKNAIMKEPRNLPELRA